MSTVAVRLAEPAQYPAIAELTVAAYAADGQLDGEHGYERALADVAARAAAGELLVAVDTVTGEPLGAVLFVLPGTPYAELSRPGQAEFRMLAVLPSAQGRGVGRALVAACVARAAGADCHELVICVRDFSTRAHRFYQRLGFTRARELDWSPAPGVGLLALRLPVGTAGQPAAAPAIWASSS